MRYECRACGERYDDPGWQGARVAHVCAGVHPDHKDADHHAPPHPVEGLVYRKGHRDESLVFEWAPSVDSPTPATPPHVVAEGKGRKVVKEGQ